MSTAALTSAEVDGSDSGYEPPRDGGKQKAWLIQGVTVEGQRFRPSDWAERISSLMAAFNGRRLQYSTLLYPLQVNGIKCVHLDSRLQERAPGIHQQVMEFIHSNRLNVVESL